MYRNGKLTEPEFDCLFRILDERRRTFDSNLDQLLRAVNHRPKSAFEKGQVAYWKNCISCCKDLISYAHSLTEFTNGSEAIQQSRTDNSERGGDDDSDTDRLWLDT